MKNQAVSIIENITCLGGIIDSWHSHKKISKKIKNELHKKLHNICESSYKILKDK